jgi:hypothetical protein
LLLSPAGCFIPGVLKTLPGAASRARFRFFPKRANCAKFIWREPDATNKKEACRAARLSKNPDARAQHPVATHSFK